MIEIKHRYTGAVLLTVDADSLVGANLSGANLRGANLSNANLSNANLRGADLSDANLRGADLRGANLRGADLSGADLSCANLSCANLSCANLSSANLGGANLSGADLSNANLSNANLSGANLRDVQNVEVTLARLSIVPEGTLIGWKNTRDGIVKLEIPAEARRVNSYGSRKCRAEFALVLETPNGAPAHGMHDREFVYTVGTLAKPDKYDPNPQEECSNGIHFFITRAEAEAYV